MDSVDMTKGPLVYAALILAALFMIISAIMVLDRDFFLDNTMLVGGISGALAVAVIVVLILILVRTRKAVR